MLLKSFLTEDVPGRMAKTCYDSRSFTIAEGMHRLSLVVVDNNPRFSKFQVGYIY